ncbi:hypothetical protein ACFL4L_05765, partial [bacterium]
KSLLVLMALFTVFAMAQDAPEVKQEVKKSCGGCQKAVEKVENLQTVCPVMGEEINKDVYVDHEGSRVYLCCQACVDAFKKDPDTYLKKMKDAGVNLHKAPCCENKDCKGCKKHKETTKT